MKKLVLLFGLLIASTSAYADLGKVETVFNSDTVETGTTMVSRVFRIQSQEEFGAWVQATSATSVAHPCTANCGSPNYTIEMEQSPTETSADFTKPIGVWPVVERLTEATARTVSIYAIPMNYARFKITNNAATYDTVVSMKFYSRD